MPPTLQQEPSKEDEAGIAQVPAHGIFIDAPGQEEKGRPPNLTHMCVSNLYGWCPPELTLHRSSPSYESPLRHHRRNFSSPKLVKETLHARSEYSNSQDDGGAIHRINQYQIKEELGRGSFGAVHLALDQYGDEYVRRNR